MTDPAYIAKRRPDPDGLDFDGLRQEGLDLLQALSGKAWTDYNLHDPGITILEVFCYALTDLIYRTGFEVADFLAGADGRIDFEKQALFYPQDIFPSQAVTEDDYRKILFDATPEIENVWVTPVGPALGTDAAEQIPGLYDIAVIPAETAQKPEATIKKKIRESYAANRNLCEDLRQVDIIQPDYYTLHGTIAIEGQRNPVDILAEIYYRSAKFISPGLAFKPFDDLMRQGKRLEDILSGPLTECGYIGEDELNDRREYAQISDLIGIIAEIEGVEFVDTLWFGNGLTAIQYDRTRQSMPRLHFPREEEEIAVRLEKDGRTLSPDFFDVKAAHDRHMGEDDALRRIRHDVAGICDPPQGEYRQLDRYHSIQNDFPDIYGIGKQGLPRPIPRGDTAGRQARARQLKAYLLFFEQVMANYLAHLQSLPRLFSLDEKLDRSYFHQLLDNTIVPAVAEVYTHKPADVDDLIRNLLRRYDNFSDRRNRILDYLLGIYGERFTQSSLRRVQPDGPAHAFEKEMIANKIRLLKAIRELSRERAGALNYLEASWGTDNCSSLQKKVSILLGLKNGPNRSLGPDAEPPGAEGCHLIEHILLRPLSKASHDPPVPNDFYAFKISVLFPAWTPRFRNEAFRKLAEETVQLNCPAHVFPVFYWLEEAEMNTFEKLYRNWLSEKCDHGADEDQIDACARRLIVFLLEQQEAA